MVVTLTKYDYLDPKLIADKLASAINAIGGGGGGGMTLISSGKITTPVQYFDVALPSGYFALTLEVGGIIFSESEELAAAVSKDAGVSFYCDVTHGDTYSSATWDPVNSFSIGLTNSLVSLDSMKFVGPNRYSIWIEKGDSSVGFVLKAENMSISALRSPMASQWVTMLNPSATSPPTYAPINLIRFLPYGNGDCPPTSGETIIAGIWMLFGIPTPA